MKRYTQIGIGIVLAIIVIGSIWWVATRPPEEEGIVTYIQGIDASWPPYTMIDEEGNAVGFDVDMCKWAGEDQGIKVEAKAAAWESIVPLLKKGDIDLVSMAITSERMEEVMFTMPFYSSTVDFYVKAGSGITEKDLISGVEGKPLKLGYRLGGMPAEKWMHIAIDEWGWNLETEPYESQLLSFESLDLGRIDVSINDSVFAVPMIKAKYTDFVSIGSIGPLSCYGIAVRKGDWDLLNKLNAGLDHLVGTAAWREMQEKWEGAYP